MLPLVFSHIFCIFAVFVTVLSFKTFVHSNHIVLYVEYCMPRFKMRLRWKPNNQTARQELNDHNTSLLLLVYTYALVLSPWATRQPTGHGLVGGGGMAPCPPLYPPLPAGEWPSHGHKQHAQKLVKIARVVPEIILADRQTDRRRHTEDRGRSLHHVP